MTLKLFNKHEERYTHHLWHEPRARITKCKYLRLNRGCVRNYFIGIKDVMIFCDLEKSIIGIKSIENASPVSFKITSMGKKDRCGSISIKSVLRKMGKEIQNIQTKNIVPVWDDKNQMLLFEIKDIQNS